MIYPLLFGLSGFAGILYQIIWLRWAFGYFGIITPVLSVVISVFMLGLGAGSILTGRWLEGRRPPRGTSWLHVYGWVELGIGLSAVAVPALFRFGDTLLLGSAAMSSIAYLLRSAVTVAASLLPACFLMGMTYPMMLAHLRTTGQERQTNFSLLYGANVLGALAAAILTPFLLIEWFGFRSTHWIGVGCSVLAGMTAILYARAIPTVRTQSVKSVETRNEQRGKRPELLWLLFITGFVSMGFEVLWTRMFTPILGTTIYAFAAVLACYLAATWFGTWSYRRHTARAGALPGSVVYGALCLAAFIPIFLNDPRFPLGPAVALMSLIPFCLGLGYTTPMWIDLFSGGESKAAGEAYAVNVAGCVLGPLVASYLLLPWAGAKAGVVILGLLLVSRIRRAPAFAAGSLGLALVGLFFLRSSEEYPPGVDSAAVIRRDYAATVVSSGSGFDRRLYVNGIGITALTPLTKVMAHLPYLFHQGEPKTALMICFGMGTTYRSLLSYGLRTTAVELVPSVRDAFAYYFDDAPSVMANPLGTVVIDDGRRFLKRTQERYDIITLDPPPPVECAGSGLLYSNEFYALVKQRLAPGGVLQQWWPGGDLRILHAVARSLQASFPHIRVYKGLGGLGFHFLASEDPLEPPSLRQALMRMPSGARQDLLEWNPGYELAPLVKPFFAKPIPLEVMIDADDPAITDDHPVNEYYLLRYWQDSRRGKYVAVK